MGHTFYDLLKDAAFAGGGGSSPAPAPVLIEKSVTQNGTYTAADDEADGYSSVSVAVPNTYAAGDEGKVVQNGALISQTSTSVSQNGTINTTTNNTVTVNVPNSYAASDEGKVVSNGALVAQGSDTVTQNGTVDTTLISSLAVNVPTAGQITSLFKLEPYKNNCVSDLYIGTIITSGIECWFMFGSIELLTTQYGIYLIVPPSFDTSKITYTERIGTSNIYGGSVSSLNWINASYNSDNNCIYIAYSGSGYFVSGHKYSFTCINHS